MEEGTGAGARALKEKEPCWRHHPEGGRGTDPSFSLHPARHFYN